MRKKRRPGYARKQQTLPLQSPKKSGAGKTGANEKRAAGQTAGMPPPRFKRAICGPGHGRWPMNRRGQGTGARPAPGRAIRKRRSRRKRPARHPQSGMCKNPAWAAKNQNGGHAAAALQTRNSRPGRGRWPMNRRGRGTGARPAPGRAIRKRGNGAENRHKTRREQSNAGRTAVRTVQQHEWMGRIRPIRPRGPDRETYENRDDCVRCAYARAQRLLRETRLYLHGCARFRIYAGRPSNFPATLSARRLCPGKSTGRPGAQIPATGRRPSR